MYVLKQVGSKGFALSEKIQDGSLDMALHTPSRKNIYKEVHAQIQIYTYKHTYLHIKKKILLQCPLKRFPNCPKTVFPKEADLGSGVVTSSVLLCQQLL